MIIIDKWAGLVTNASPYAIPPGAAVTQVNLQVLTPGQLVVRSAMTAHSYASSEGNTRPIRAMARVQAASGIENILYQNAAGELYAVRASS